MGEDGGPSAVETVGGVVRALNLPVDRIALRAIIAGGDGEVRELHGQVKDGANDLRKTGPATPLGGSPANLVVEDVEGKFTAPKSRLIAREEGRVEAAEGWRSVGYLIVDVIEVCEVAAKERGASRAEDFHRGAVGGEEDEDRKRRKCVRNTTSFHGEESSDRHGGRKKTLGTSPQGFQDS